MIAANRVRQSIPAEPPPPDSPEGLKARWWREHRLRQSRPQFSKLVGFSVQQIGRFESFNEVPRAYKVACYGFDIGFLKGPMVDIPGEQFRWGLP